MENSGSGKLLLVEDDQVFRTRLARALRSRGFMVTEASGMTGAMQAAEEERFDFAVLDLSLGDGSGLEVMRMLNSVSPLTRSVVLTGFGTIATAVEALKLGAVNYITKPANADQIVEALRGGTGVRVESDKVPTLSQVEWEHMNRVLNACNGNISHAAKMLGLHRRSLQRKLNKAPGRLN